jgi:hypothetical protein
MAFGGFIILFVSFCRLFLIVPRFDCVGAPGGRGGFGGGRGGGRGGGWGGDRGGRGGTRGMFLTYSLLP